MNCERMETQLIAYLDGKAAEKERRDVEQHLAACAACRARAEEFRRVWAVLDEAPGIEPSLGFDAHVRQRIAAEPPAPGGPLAWMIPQPRFALALSVLVALAIWLSALPPAVEIAQTPDEEFQMIQNLPVLEDYEVLANFEPLDQLSAAKQEKVDR
jgi:anti-sigma factor RsiW